MDALPSQHNPSGTKDSTLFLDSESPDTCIKPASKLGTSVNDASGGALQRIVIENARGEKLVGVLHETGSNELIVLCHGFRSSKESKTILCIADALVSQNISVFRFDFSGNGESEGSFQYGNYWKEVEDLRALIGYFSQQKRAVQAIAGHSKGGNVVLLYASKYNDIPIVVNISGRFDLKRGIEDRLGKDYMTRIKNDGYIDVKDKMHQIIYRVTEESLLDRLSTDMRGAALAIDKNCRVLTIHGSEDDIVPSEDAREFDKYIGNHKLEIIEGADHRYSSHQSQLTRIIIDFITTSQM